MVHGMDCDGCRTGSKQSGVDYGGNEMKEYTLIAVCMLAGKYVDIPIWLNIAFAITTCWTVKQINKEWE